MSNNELAPNIVALPDADPEMCVPNLTVVPPEPAAQEPPNPMEVRIDEARQRLGAQAWDLIFVARQHFAQELASIRNHGSVRARQFRSYIETADVELGLVPGLYEEAESDGAKNHGAT